jgi:hypothetical protein
MKSITIQSQSIFSKSDLSKRFLHQTFRRFWFPLSELRPELIVSALIKLTEERHKIERTRVFARAHTHTRTP